MSTNLPCMGSNHPSLARISLPNYEGISKEKGKGRMSVDEIDVTKAQSTLSNWVNPFLQSGTGELCHIASGMTAPKKVEEDLCTAYDKGKEAMAAFIRKTEVDD